MPIKFLYICIWTYIYTHGHIFLISYHTLDTRLSLKHYFTHKHAHSLTHTHTHTHTHKYTYTHTHIHTQAVVVTDRRRRRKMSEEGEGDEEEEEEDEEGGDDVSAILEEQHKRGRIDSYSYSY